MTTQIHDQEAHSLPVKQINETQHTFFCKRFTDLQRVQVLERQRKTKSSWEPRFPRRTGHLCRELQDRLMTPDACKRGPGPSKPRFFLHRSPTIDPVHHITHWRLQLDQHRLSRRCSHFRVTPHSRQHEHRPKRPTQNPVSRLHSIPNILCAAAHAGVPSLSDPCHTFSSCPTLPCQHTHQSVQLTRGQWTRRTHSLGTSHCTPL